MAKKKGKEQEKGPQRVRQELPMQEAIFSNSFGVGGSDDGVFINFGVHAPSYFEDDFRVFPVARVILPWHAAEGLLDLLQQVVSKYHKERKKQRVKLKDDG